MCGGLVAGLVNTLAGGGSLLTVPLLVMIGLPGGLANGTNRVGILIQSGMAAWRFQSRGVARLSDALPVLVPVALGSVVGALLIAQLEDQTFERIFGLVMVLLLIPILRRPRGGSPDGPNAPRSPVLRGALFFAIGLYGGALQAGVGIALLYALSFLGSDLVRSNAIKVVVVAALTLVALPVFAIEGQIAWLPAGILAVGFAAGGELGARLAVRGGERVIRPVLALAVVALAGRMLGLY
ncbi:MAG: sulfite exporter TauE/SafE family protein [Myxococcota bacterium]